MKNSSWSIPALYTALFRKIVCNPIGIQPRHSRELILADDRRERRPLGEALFILPKLGETLTCPVIFAPKDSLYLLDATALETFGVEADPTEKKLRPILGIIGGFRASR